MEDKSAEKGMDNLLSYYTNALEDNSKRIVEILERLSTSNLSFKDRKNLKRVKSELKKMDSKQLEHILDIARDINIAKATASQNHKKR